MFGGISLSNIIEGISITVGSTVVLALVYRFRKIIAAWVKRRFNRLRRFVKMGQCFPQHTLEFCNLVRQNKQLSKENRNLHSKLAQYHLNSTQKNDRLMQAVINILIFSLYHNHNYWLSVEAMGYFNWNQTQTMLAIDKAIKMGFIKKSFNNQYEITAEGRYFLYQENIIQLPEVL